MMERIVTIAVAGVLGTLAMDLLNQLFARLGAITKIEMAGIGRMAAGWTRGRFVYGDPGELQSVTYETLYGYLMHYGIGLGFAAGYVVGWELLVGWPVSPVWALAFGVATTAASWFLVYPSMGLGAFGRRHPEGLKAAYSSLANHLFYGLGLAAGVVITG